METSPQRTFTKEINTWVQTIGIIIAAAWGAYTFIYKEIMVPKSAPVNITVNLQLKKIGSAGSQAQTEEKRLLAVEMRISATNPSAREVYLLPSVWIVSGHKINALPNNIAFGKGAVSALNSRKGLYVEKHAFPSATSIVATGSLFTDDVLKPNETATRTILFHVPPGRYDMLEAFATMPSMSKKGGAELEWKFEKNDLVPVMYRVTASGERKKFEVKKDGGYSAPRIGLQTVVSRSALSLW